MKVKIDSIHSKLVCKSQTEVSVRKDKKHEINISLQNKKFEDYCQIKINFVTCSTASRSPISSLLKHSKLVCKSQTEVPVTVQKYR